MELNDKNRSADKWLDTALEHYSDAEPPLGLEVRVLATLRAERERKGTNQWRRPHVAAPISAMNHPGISVVPKVLERSIASHDIGVPTIAQPATLRHPNRSLRVAHETKAPHLDQFPSAQPLNEQEQLLARYVSEHLQEAQLVAQARAELLQKDMAEFEKQTPAPKSSQDFEQ